MHGERVKTEFCVLYGSHNKQLLFPYTELMGFFSNAVTFLWNVQIECLYTIKIILVLKRLNLFGIKKNCHSRGRTVLSYLSLFVTR